MIKPTETEDNQRLTDAELQEFKSIQGSYQQLIIDLGAVEFNASILKKQSEELASIKENLLNQLNEADSKRQELSNKLGEKYGEKQVDLETGELK